MTIMLFSSSHFPLIWLTRTRSTRGRNVTQEMIFHSLEAYVDDTVTGQYYAWTEQDLGPDRYVQITGISFDFWGTISLRNFLLISRRTQTQSLSAFPIACHWMTKNGPR